MKNATRLLSFAILFGFANIILLSTAKLLFVRVREDARNTRDTTIEGW